MMATSGQIQVVRSPVQLVNSTESLGEFVRDLCSRIHNEDFSSRVLALYIDLEGINLCRHGSISLLTILVRERRWVTDENWESHTQIMESVYVLDIKTLGASTFSTVASEGTKEDVDGIDRLSPASPSSRGLGSEDGENVISYSFPSRVGTLKEVLESPDPPKIFFDVRNDADALFAHFGIHLRGTMDLQLLENFKRHHCHENTKFLHGLATCIRNDSRMNSKEKQAWEDAKEKGRRMFAPERGGQYAVFDKRPLDLGILAYCVQDVLCMPDLWQVYSQMLPRSLLPGQGVAHWRRTIKKATKMRVKDAESASYNPYYSRAKVLAPDWATVVYDPSDSDEDFDLLSPPETGRDFESIKDSD